MKKIFEPLEFASSLEGIAAFTTLRGDARTDDNYSEFNICNYTGDSHEHIVACRRLLCRHLNVDDARLIMPRQTHSVNVAEITARSHRDVCLDDVDALVTNLPDIVIGINTADCVPLVFADPAGGIIGAAHAGWKGTKNGIVARTVQAMCRLGADPQRIMIAIGAAICQDCFEVGDEVVEQFADAGFDLNAIVRRNPITGKAHIDLPEANRITAMQSGVPDANINLSGRCTRCQPMRYFSARRIGIRSGRIFTAIIRRSR